MAMGLGKKLAVGAALGAAYAITQHALAQTELATGPFTAGQMEAGRKVYLTRCASCHQANLAGQGDAFALAGSQFLAGWGNRTTQDLFKLIQSSMPKNAPGDLDDQSTANVTAFILHENGAKPGPMTFLRAPPLRISLIANGIAPGDVDTGAAPRP
jgi:mono/diheme cytochrome c family protein